MAEQFLRDNPVLRPFVLSDVELTGSRIGGGAYGRVEEVIVPVGAAAKTIYNFLQEGDGTAAEPPKASVEFVRECQLMSTIRHPNIVQFLGVTFFPGSRLPALVMELLLTSLHDLLAPDAPPPVGSPAPLSFFCMALKCSVLQNVGHGLAYLHERSPPIIHRDLSARNVLLTHELVAKIADLGVARNLPSVNTAATMTKGPGAIAYMLPEAFAPTQSSNEKSKYDASIDIFSFGVVTIFTIGETFPCDPLEPNYVDEKSGLLVARTELQRRSHYMEHVNDRLYECAQFREDHPVIRLIHQCLHNLPARRPGIRNVIRLLEEARATLRSEDCERNKVQLFRALQTQPRNKNFEHVFHEATRENSNLQSLVQQLQTRIHMKDCELIDAQEELRMKEEHVLSCERERLALQQQLVQREAEMTRAVDTIREKDQQIQEIRCQETELVVAMKRELTWTHLQLRQKEEQLQASNTVVTDLQHHLMKLSSYRCQVHGPGLTSATVNHPTHVTVEVTDSFSTPFSLPLAVSAKLEHMSKAVPHDPSGNILSVSMTSPSKYEVKYTAINRGLHKIVVLVNKKKISGSPFILTVFPDPMQLGCPVRVLKDLNGPYGITFNKHKEMIVSECDGHRLSVFDISQKKIRTFGTYGQNPDEMVAPKGIATDGTANVYVSSLDKLQKFSVMGELIKCIGKTGKKEGEFAGPRGVTLHNSLVYVCDRSNHRIQVFDLDLNFVQSIGAYGEGRVEFNAPLDVKFDNAGKMYVVEYGNGRVQVLDAGYQFIREFGLEGEGTLHGPSGIHIADKFVYVSDACDDCIVVYETSGHFVTSFGRSSDKEGEFDDPYYITSCTDGFIYVCDCGNDRVQVF